VRWFRAEVPRRGGGGGGRADGPGGLAQGVGGAEVAGGGRRVVLGLPDRGEEFQAVAQVAQGSRGWPRTDAPPTPLAGAKSSAEHAVPAAQGRTALA
jgi:hypothetical protein